MHQHEALIVGAGFAGVWAALAAARLADQAGQRDTIRISLVGPAPSLCLRPRLYEADPEVWEANLEPLLQAAGIRFIAGTMGGLDPERRSVGIRGSDGVHYDIGFDTLVLACGSVADRPRIPGLAEHGFSVDDLVEAKKLRAHLFALAASPGDQDRDTVVVAGAGFTGIELAAELRSLDSWYGLRRPKVILVEQREVLGPDLGSAPRSTIERALRDLGVEFRTKATIVAIRPHEVVLATGERISTPTVVWSGGLRANPAASLLSAPKDALGRIFVERDLSLPGANGLFAAGDVACALTDDAGHRTLMSCQHAMATGRYAGHNSVARILNLPTSVYSQPEYVTCLDLGDWGAVFTQGWSRQVAATGSEAKAIKRMINESAIYPPPADRSIALAMADPAWSPARA